MNTVEAFARMKHCRELAVFYRQWCAIESAGLPLQEGLQSLQKGSPPVVHERIEGILQSVEHGSLEPQVGVGGMTAAEVAFIRIGASTGYLERALGALAGLYDADHRTVVYARRKAMYPMVVALCGCWIPTLPLAFFMAPWVWVMLGGLGTAAVLSFGGVVIWRYFVWLRSRPKLAQIRFFWALSAALEAGLVLEEALPLATEVTAPSDLSQQLRYIVPNGRSITELLTKAGVFDGAIMSMIATGEASGRLPETLNRVANFLEDGTL